jgi:hypothetical protein
LPHPACEVAVLSRKVDTQVLGCVCK